MTPGPSGPEGVRDGKGVPAAATCVGLKEACGGEGDQEGPVCFGVRCAGASDRHVLNTSRDRPVRVPPCARFLAFSISHRAASQGRGPASSRPAPAWPRPQATPSQQAGCPGAADAELREGREGLSQAKSGGRASCCSARRERGGGAAGGEEPAPPPLPQRGAEQALCSLPAWCHLMRRITVTAWNETETAGAGGRGQPGELPLHPPLGSPERWPRPAPPHLASHRVAKVLCPPPAGHAPTGPDPRTRDLGAGLRAGTAFPGGIWLPQGLCSPLQVGQAWAV